MSEYCHSCGNTIEEDTDTICGLCKAKRAARVMVKDFHQMTADEIANYHGLVYWARTSHLNPDGRTIGEHDHESTTSENLEAKLRTCQRLTIHSRGVR